MADRELTEREKLEAAVAEAKARREEARVARDDARAPDRLRAELALVTRQAEMDAIYDELESKHGSNEIRRVDADDGSMLVVSRPASVAFKRFQQSKTSVDDCDAFVRTCLVYPSKEGYNELVSKWPAKIVEGANVASELAGIRRKEASGK